MIDLATLKDISSTDEILDLLKSAILFGGNLWQSHEDIYSRTVAQIHKISLDHHTKNIILKIPLGIKINPALPIYVKLNYRNSIFRLMPSEYELNKDLLICLYPKHMRALDKRLGGDRYVLPFHADLSLSLKRTERIPTEITHELECRISDVSKKGFGILISGYNRFQFGQHDYFWLRAVDQRALKTPILGSVCYVSSTGHGLKHTSVRLGLSLSIPVEEDIFENLKKKSTLILSA